MTVMACNTQQMIQSRSATVSYIYLVPGVCQHFPPLAPPQNSSLITFLLFVSWLFHTKLFICIESKRKRLIQSPGMKKQTLLWEHTGVWGSSAKVVSRLERSTCHHVVLVLDSSVDPETPDGGSKCTAVSPLFSCHWSTSPHCCQVCVCV